MLASHEAEARAIKWMPWVESLIVKAARDGFHHTWIQLWCMSYAFRNHAYLVETFKFIQQFLNIRGYETSFDADSEIPMIRVSWPSREMERKREKLSC